MIKYHCTTRFVDDGFFSQAEDSITKIVQPHLDEATEKGWTLHSFTSNETERGVSIIFMWQRERYEPETI